MRQSSSNTLVTSVVTAIVMLCFSGCSAIVSPYNGEFQCPDTDKGKCASVQTAYKESMDNPLVKTDPGSPAETEGKSDKPPCETCGEGSHQLYQGKAMRSPTEPVHLPDTPASRDPEYRYQDALYRKLASLIRQPSTPVVVPPDVVRVLILSYTGSDNELFSYRYVYFFATDPKWIISTGKEVN